jgi:hypothetical protein
VVRAGGDTKLTDANKVDGALNPVNSKPLASCPVVLTTNDLGSGAVTD